MEVLRSSVHDDETRDDVIEAAMTKFSVAERDVSAFFEHGHWWIRVADFYGEDGDATFSVVDAQSKDREDYLDFEEL